MSYFILILCLSNEHPIIRDFGYIWILLRYYSELNELKQLFNGKDTPTYQNPFDSLE